MGPFTRGGGETGPAWGSKGSVLIGHSPHNKMADTIKKARSVVKPVCMHPDSSHAKYAARIFLEYFSKVLS
jgi:hypothetical protein